MRVALVQCPPWGSLPPLGSASLKAYIEQHGHEAPCFDLNIDYCRERLQEALNDVGGSVYARPDPWVSGSFDEWDFEFDGEVRFNSSLQDRPLPIERWADAVLDCDPRVVGFSVQSTNLGVTLQLAQHIGRRAPSVKLVFGGPNVAEAQQGAMALLTGIPDVVVEGEGEATLLELLDAFESGRDLAEVAGIGRLVDGRPTWTERRPLLPDVDALPFPDFSDFDWSLYPNPYEIPIMTSRGCVLNCAFCYETVYWQRFRTQSPQRIVAEIRHQLANHPFREDAEEKGVRFGMSFADSLVNGHLAGLRRMAQQLIESDLDIYWNGQATLNTKMDDDYVRDLAASGCTGLSFGLESGSQHVLESMGKRFDIEDAGAFFDRVHRAGIEVVVNIMVGFPTETRADFVETLRLLRRVRKSLHMVNNVGATAVVGGSRIHQSPDDYGVTPVDIRGWNDGDSFQWESEAAGTEQERQRRVRLLHMWMTVMRIRHQRIGPSSGSARGRMATAVRSAVTFASRLTGRTPGSGAPETDHARRPPVMRASTVRARIRRLERSRGEEPLVVNIAADRIDAPSPPPEWAASLMVDTWTGLHTSELRALLSTRLGDGLGISDRVGAGGVQDVVLKSLRPSGELRGLRVYVFPSAEPGGPQVAAIFPLEPTPGATDQLGSDGAAVGAR
ncbi:MAG: radical SAM protein [Acidimicrobiales bacterium]